LDSELNRLSSQKSWSSIYLEKC